MKTSTKHKSPKVLLLSTPFLMNMHPPAGIGLLKAYLVERGYSVDVEHLSLQLNNLIDPSLYDLLADSDLYNEAIYSVFLFPSKKRAAKIRLDFNERMRLSKDGIKKHRFSKLIQTIDQFNRHVENTIFKKKYDVVGFTTVSNQLLASLYFSKRYKEIHPKSVIVFGGAQSHGDLGRSHVNAFSWLDYVVDGEGEETLVDLLEAIANKRYGPIDGCSGRIEGKIFNAPPRRPISSLDSLPIPDYNDFFYQLNKENNCILEVALPIQTTRGCWWSKCVYCNFCKLDAHYRKFSPQRIRQTMDELADRHRVLFFRCVDIMHYQPPEKLCEELMRSSRKFRLFQQMRATLTLDEVRALKQAGIVEVQLGIESLSSSVLRKMNKGTTAIQNVQAIKFVKQLGLKLYFNLMTGYPGETKSDFKETMSAIKTCWHLVHDFAEASFTLENPSEMTIDPARYGITKMRPQSFYKNIFPKKYLEMIECHRLDYDTKRPIQGSYRESLEKENWLGDKRPSLTYEDGHTFIVINDHRRSDRSFRLWFERHVRDIYIYCDRIRTLDEIKKQFASLSSGKISRTLEQLCRDRLMLKENNLYISLAISHDGP